MWFILLRSENHIERSWWLHGNRFDRTEFQIKSTAWLGQTIIWLSWWWWQLILIVWQWKKLRTNFYHWRYHRLWREFSHKHMFLHEKWSQSGHRISRSTGKAEMNKITLQPIHQLRFLLVIQLIFSSLFFFLHSCIVKTVSDRWTPNTRWNCWCEFWAATIRFRYWRYAQRIERVNKSFHTKVPTSRWSGRLDYNLKQVSSTTFGSFTFDLLQSEITLEIRCFFLSPSLEWFHPI